MKRVFVIAVTTSEEPICSSISPAAPRRRWRTGRGIPVRQRMREGVAEHDRRAQIDAAFELHLARTVAILRGDIVAPGVLQAVLDRAVDELRHLRIGEAAESFASGSFVRERRDRAELLRERIGDFRGVLRHHDGAGIDAGAAAVVRDGTGDQVDVVAPVLDLSPRR